MSYLSRHGTVWRELISRPGKFWSQALSVPGQHQPMFNLPRTILLATVLLILVHVVRSLLSPEADLYVILRFAFIPARYDFGAAPGGFGADIWTFVTYTFLHGDAVHLGVNLLWLVAFGSPVAWRLGFVRFVLLCMASSAAGAALHLATHTGEIAPMVGASAAIAGLMAASMRFAFVRGAPLGALRQNNRTAFLQPALSIRESFSNPQILAFAGVWMAINLIFGVGSIAIGDGEASIAWQAHIGGFAVGLLAFVLFDPIDGHSNEPENPIQN